MAFILIRIFSVPSTGNVLFTYSHPHLHNFLKRFYISTAHTTPPCLIHPHNQEPHSTYPCISTNVNSNLSLSPARKSTLSSSIIHSQHCFDYYLQEVYHYPHQMKASILAIHHMMETHIIIYPLPCIEYFLNSNRFGFVCEFVILTCSHSAL